MLQRPACAALALSLAACATPAEPEDRLTVEEMNRMPAEAGTEAARSREEEEVYEGYLLEIIWEAQERSGARAVSGEYPVVLTDVASQKALGLLESNYGPYAGEPELGHKCYYYGDGGSLLSMSDEFLARYRAQGITLETLCMALVTGMRFDPETGTRLATVVMADIEELSRSDYFGEPGPISDEIPLQIPACFRRGLPLVDCRFAYDPISGAPLTPNETAKIAAAGARAYEEARALIAGGKYAQPCGRGDRPTEDESCYSTGRIGSGYPEREYRINANHPAMLPLGGFYVFSPELDQGFAYAVMADGAAGPSASMESVQLVLEGKTRATQAKLEALKIAGAKSQ